MLCSDMGCGLSKIDNSELVDLCRERKELIKAAKDCRYALASAHIFYFQSFLDVGNALFRLVEEEVVTSVEQQSNTDSDHQSKGEGSYLEFSSLESDTDIDSLTDYVHNGSEVSVLSPEEDDSQQRVNSNVYHMQKSSEEVTIGVYEQPQIVDAAAQWLNPSNFVVQYPQYGNWASPGAPGNFQPDDPRILQYGNGESFGGPMKISPVNSRFTQLGNGVSFGGLMTFPLSNLSFSHHGNGVSFDDAMNIPPNIPPTFHRTGGGVFFNDPMNHLPRSLMFPQYGNMIITGGMMNFPYNNLSLDQHVREADLLPNAFSFPQDGIRVPYGGSMDFLPHDPYHNLRQIPTSPQSPPPPEISNWDYLNPFNVVDDTFSNYDSKGRYETDLSSIGPNLRKVREREGIPDLEEDEEEQTLVEEPKEIESKVNNKWNTDEGPFIPKTRNGYSGEGSTEAVPLKRDSGEGPSEAAWLKNSEDILLAQEKETTSIHGVPATQKRDIDSIEKDPESNLANSNCLEEGEKNNNRDVEVKEALKQEGVSSLWVSSTHFDTHESRDFKEVLKEIRDTFETAFDHGKDVSVALEAGKLQYQPRSATLKVFSSWILRFMVPSTSTSSPLTHMKSKRSAFGAIKKAKANNEGLEANVCVKSANLSSTLEKLYVWERKLYKEVKDEERLRIVYTKQWKRLKELDDRGAESSKIDATHHSIKKLLPKINVAVSAVDAISRRIHTLRDEELQPQLNELLHRLTGMWRFMMECHQKQFQAIVEARSSIQIARAGTERNPSGAEATRKLEMGILRWAAGFTDWINTQKAFGKYLNGCLMKCLLHEPEEIADEISPFSPTRLGAPSVFIMCYDWYHAIKNVSETGVSKALHDFASMLHQLGEKLDEERHQRVKVEFLSKDIEKRVKSIYEESGINWSQDNNAASSEDGTEIVAPIPDGLHVDLKRMWNRLKDEQASHEEVIKQVNDAASHGLRLGLIRVFEALGIFSLEMLKAYEQVRILPSGEGKTE